MAVFNGSTYVLTIVLDENDLNENNKAFVHSTDCSISFSNALVEATLGKSDGWTEVVSGKKTTQINFSGLQDFGTYTDKHNTEDLAEYLLDSTVLYFDIGHLVDGNYHGFEHGKGYISELTLEGGSDDVATYSGVLEMIGELSAVPEDNREKIQDSDGNDILDDFGLPIYAKIR